MALCSNLGFTVDERAAAEGDAVAKLCRRMMHVNIDIMCHICSHVSHSCNAFAVYAVKGRAVGSAKRRDSIEIGGM